MKFAFNKKVSTTAIDPYARQITAEAITVMLRNTPSVNYAAQVMVFLLVWVLWERIDHLILLTWATFAATISLLDVQFSRQFFRRRPSHNETALWGRYYTYLTLLQGLVWGGAGMLFFVSDSAALQVFLLTTMGVVAIASIVHHSYWLESYYAFIMPLLILPGLRLYWEGDSAYQGLAVLTLLLLTIVIVLAHDSQKLVLGSIRLRFENLDLIDQFRKEKEKAEIASTDKTRFLASASHDLRQPVHALSLFADALNRELTVLTGTNNSPASALLGSMEHSIHALNQLLGSLLDISKLDANIVQPGVLHFNVRTLLTSLHNEYQLQAQAKTLTYDTKIDGELMVYSDPVLLESILRNLIGNALSYTHKGGITVTANLGSSVHIEVRDSGIGISPEHQQEIFREFFQVANTERDRTKGLGLGLAIVERTCTLLHCQIKLESESGKGSVFKLEIPFDAFKVVGTPDEKNATAANSSAAMDLTFDQINMGLTGMRVLVIDDEIAVREAMKAVLHGWGCVAILASSEHEAVQNLQDQIPPQVIVADYRLREGMTGVDAIRRIHQEFGADIPALIITGDTDPARLREAQASGYTLMHKPIQPAKLRVFLQRIRRKLPAIDQSQ